MGFPTLKEDRLSQLLLPFLGRATNTAELINPPIAITIAALADDQRAIVLFFHCFKRRVLFVIAHISSAGAFSSNYMTFYPWI